MRREDLQRPCKNVELSMRCRQEGRKNESGYNIMRVQKFSKKKKQHQPSRKLCAWKKLRTRKNTLYFQECLGKSR
jgi:hypothetical protein